MMEVDLLSQDLRIAVELDGPQHLADLAAYRRDRRKDHLLQEHGYLVLRFLAEDVVKDLDGVLDALLRAVDNRGRAIRDRTGDLALPVRCLPRRRFRPDYVVLHRYNRRSSSASVRARKRPG